MTIAVDEASNTLTIRAPEPLVSEVERYVKDLDASAQSETSETMQVVHMRHAAASSIQSSLQSILGDQATITNSGPDTDANNSSGSSSGSGGNNGVGGSSRQSGSSGGGSNNNNDDDARRRAFLDAIRQQSQQRGGGGPPGGGFPGGGFPGGGRGSRGGR
jgi:hypothetical protein